MCGMKRGRRSKGDTWWCNEEMKEAVSIKKVYNEICQNSTEENDRRYNSL